MLHRFGAPLVDAGHLQLLILTLRLTASLLAMAIYFAGALLAFWQTSSLPAMKMAMAIEMMMMMMMTTQHPS